jgi:CheY-like chemotaxis protein
MKKKKILVVDDETTITQPLKTHLERTGKYEVHAENDGRKAIAVAKKFHPDLALLDVMMPGMDGGDVKNGLRALPEFNELPIIFLTGATTPNEHNDKDIFLSKPARVREILDCIDHQLAPQIGEQPQA